MRDLFVPLSASHDGDVVIDSAIALAQAYRARISLWLPPPMLGVDASWGFAPAPTLAALVERAELVAADRASTLRGRLRAARVEGDASVSPVPLQGHAAAMVMRAHCADLLVIACQQESNGSTSHATFASLLAATGRPVLVVPSNRAVPAQRVRKILLAWQPTREAARACEDALAVLQPDEAVVVAVDPGSDEVESAAVIAAHLARKGLQVDVATRRCTRSVARTLFLEADARGADAIVAGGYGHARLREWVLGGTTRELFAGLERPVLFSH